MKDQFSLDESTRNAYLHALDIQQWHERDLASEEDVAEYAVEEVKQHAATVAQVVNQPKAKVLESLPAESYIPTTVKIDVDKISKMDLSSLELHVRGCDACDLHKTRKQTVFGVGHHKADWLLLAKRQVRMKIVKANLLLGEQGNY